MPQPDPMMLLRSRLATPSYARPGSGLSGESDSRSKADTPAAAELTGSAQESELALEAPSGFEPLYGLAGPLPDLASHAPAAQPAR